MSIGKAISSLRKENKLTQQDLATKLHVTYQAVSKWENDLSQPDLDTIVRLAEIFNVSVDVLISKDNKKEKECKEVEYYDIEEIKYEKSYIVPLCVFAYSICLFIALRSYFDLHIALVIILGIFTTYFSTTFAYLIYFNKSIKSKYERCIDLLFYLPNKIDSIGGITYLFKPILFILSIIFYLIYLLYIVIYSGIVFMLGVVKWKKK